jgi:hypothetical protein
MESEDSTYDDSKSTSSEEKVHKSKKERRTEKPTNSQVVPKISTLKSSSKEKNEDIQGMNLHDSLP